ncbi:Pex14p [Sugiyamaella lignohabitans]|uniref:Peroxisomal membrane protein PEX14 n=1 Tax=Sugiyamaella lignohabitans TaxID=796027 RepID=A0A161HHS1_9ASCO|nr:Pex14p [Sugiyamaella lignohabitans]ANB11787.1 Pex14p [Sugiyamaella lignohabitans]
MREELVRSAVSFLNDPQVADATLAKRIEFLESKGLTKEEVEEALTQATNGNSSPKSPSSLASVPITGVNSTTVKTAYLNQPHIPPLSLPPPVPKRDWKDYFVMATVSAGVAYGLYEVTRRYVLPLILPPTPSSLESDKEALEAEFTRAESLLEQLHKDTEEIKEAELQRKEQFTTVLQEAQDAIETVKGQSQQIEADMKLIKTQVDTIKDTLPKSLEKNRDQQDKALLEIQEELKSLKQLITNRLKSSSLPASLPPASSVPSTIPKFAASSVSSTSGPSPSSTSTNEGSTSLPVLGTNSSIVSPFSKPSVPYSEQTSPATSSTTPTPKPGLPAWQVAAASKYSENEAAS